MNFWGLHVNQLTATVIQRKLQLQEPGLSLIWVQDFGFKMTSPLTSLLVWLVGASGLSSPKLVSSESSTLTASPTSVAQANQLCLALALTPLSYGLSENAVGSTLKIYSEPNVHHHQRGPATQSLTCIIVVAASL